MTHTASSQAPSASPSSAERIKEQASETASQITEQAGQQAQQLAGQAKGQWYQQLDERSTQAGQQVASVAADLRSAANSLRQQDSAAPAARAMEPLAERLEGLGQYLKDADGQQLMSEVARIGRTRPWALAGVGLAAGWALGRFLQASAAPDSSSGPRGQQPLTGSSERESRSISPPATHSLSEGTVVSASTPTENAPAQGFPPSGSALGLSGAQS